MNEERPKNPQTNNKANGLKVLILGVILVVVVIVLISCLVRGCSRKLGDLLGGAEEDAYFLGYNNSDFTSNYYTGSGTSNTGRLDTSVAEGAREKRTQIKGDGKDVVTVMVYVCGADLESKGGAATMDIQEMLDANVGENVNLILYTGGTTKWQNRQMSSSVNQIYQVSGNSLYLLKKNAGSKSMTDPSTLAEFISFCKKNFPANRNMLILWDHGGGSVTGYGSDENFSYTGPMDLEGIGKALKKGGVDFDFVGFDACLMATLENGLMLDNYSDYMIASEETETGYGWYYTNWLHALSRDTSLPTIEIGKAIADDFIEDAKRHGQNYAGTLSVTDLAELSCTVPDKLETFAEEITDAVEGRKTSGDYKTIAKARGASREFGSSYRIDQVDLADFAGRLQTKVSRELSEAVKSAVKYNNTTSDMTGSYGLSVYFPYANGSYINKAGKLYDAIDMPAAYTRCVESYAALELSGQYISGGTGDPFNSLFGLFGSGNYGDSSYYGNSTGSSYSSDAVSELLNSLMGGDTGGFSQDYDSFDFSFFRSSLDSKQAADYLANNQFLETNLAWQEKEDGTPVIKLSEEQWDLVSSIALNMFFDDGEGYIDLGSDNVFRFDEEGNLIGENDHTWLTIDGHYLSYYYDSMTVDEDQYVINGHSPVLVNGTPAELILRFDKEHPYGYIAGVRYRTAQAENASNIGKLLAARLAEEGNLPLAEKPDKNAKAAEGQNAGAQNEADAQAADSQNAQAITGSQNTEAPEAAAGPETVAALKEGDTVEFTADFYDYQGNFLDAYVLGDPWIVGSSEPEIANMDLGEGGALAMYVFTDIYNKQYWTGVIPEAAKETEEK